MDIPCSLCLNFFQPAILLSMFMLSFIDPAILLFMFMLSFIDPAILLFIFMLSFIDPAILLSIRVITKLPNSEQSYKGKVKTHNYINRQNLSTTGKL